MYNLRYHIASLVAVFLALALGLVLGGLVIQRGTIDDQQGSLIAGLEKEFASLREANESLSAENRRLTSFSDMLTDEWIVDRLVGRNVAVLLAAGSEDEAEPVAEAIVRAGGSPVMITVVDPGLTLDSPETIALLAPEAVESAEVTASIVASLAAEWRGPTTERPLTDALIERGALAVEGLEPGMATVGLVNMVAWEDGPDATALFLASSFAQEDAISIGAESQEAPTGVAAAVAGLGQSGVDTVGTGIGRYSIIALLSGAEDGYYGLSDEAQDPFPALPETN